MKPTIRGQQAWELIRGRSMKCVLMWLVLCAPLNVHGDDDAHTGAQHDSMDEVVITGEWAGPRLWKVSNGEHVLWILGTLQPLPKRMSWQSREVDMVLQESQELLGSIAIRPKVNVFNILPLYLQVRKIARLPDKQTLRDVLPDDLYQRYSALKMRFAANDKDLETLRPLAAAGRLYQRALDANDLTGGGEVSAAVIKLAKRHDVEVHDMTLKIDDPRGALRQLQHMPPEAELACFTALLTSLESDLDAMRMRAVAWARGDVDALRRLPLPEGRTSCWDALLSVPQVKAVNDQAQANWRAAAEAALHTHRSTLAMSPIYDLLGDKGALAKLRAAGYRIEGP